MYLTVLFAWKFLQYEMGNEDWEILEPFFINMIESFLESEYHTHSELTGLEGISFNKIGLLREKLRSGVIVNNKDFLLACFDGIDVPDIILTARTTYCGDNEDMEEVEHIRF